MEVINGPLFLGLPVFHAFAGMSGAVCESGVFADGDVVLGPRTRGDGGYCGEKEKGMRIPGYIIHGMGDVTVLDPAGVPVYAGPGAQPLESCVVGGTDAAGNTIANCPPVSSVPCLVGTGPLAPGQSYCTPPTVNIPVCPLNQVVSGNCVCPAGTSLDPTSLMCVAPSTSIFAGLPNSAIYAAAAVFGGLLLLSAFSGRRR